MWKSAVRSFLILGAVQCILAQATGNSTSGSTSASGSFSIPAGATKDSLIKSYTEALAEKKSCKMPNDFEKSKCGETNKVCCGSREACVGPVTLKLEKGEVDLYTCSAARHISGTKAIKIVIIPIFFILMDICFIIFMVLKLNVKSNHITKVCIVLIAVSWPLFHTSIWYYGVWAGFLAVFVAFMSNTQGFPWWIYRLAWGMQVFQLILLFSPNETFHVPLFNQSLAGSSSHLVRTSLALTESGCSAHFEGYFTVLSLESAAKEADPDRQYNGLCTYEWLGFVQGTLMIQGIVVMILVLLSAPFFLGASADGKGGASTAGLVKSTLRMVASAAKADDADAVRPFSDDVEKAK